MGEVLHTSPPPPHTHAPNLCQHLMHHFYWKEKGRNKKEEKLEEEELKGKETQKWEKENGEVCEGERGGESTKKQKKVKGKEKIKKQ